MRKLIRFTVNQNRPLTPVEMTEVNGGSDIYSLYCAAENQNCAVINNGVVITGKCVPAPYNPKQLVCDTSL